MDLFILIPLMGCIVACVVASAVRARDPGSRTGRRVTVLMAIGGVWSLVDLIAHLRTDAEAAILPVRIGMASTVLLGPTALALVLEAFPELIPQFSRFRRMLWGISIPLIVVTIASSQIIQDLSWTDWGWRIRPGLLWPATLVQAAASTFIIGSVFWQSRHLILARVHLPVARFVGVTFFLLLFLIALTEVILPRLGIAAPRVGTLSVTLLGGLLWLVTFRIGEFIPAPVAFAREVLDILDDGVALISTDGRVRSGNQSLLRLIGRPLENPSTYHVSDFLTESIDELNRELVEKETFVRGPGGEMTPIALSTSTFQDREGSPLGSVLVLRDLREVVELRRKLLTAGRLAAVGELAAGIAHEVNNPIAFIQSNLHCLHRNDEVLRELFEGASVDDQISEALREDAHLIGQSLQEIASVSAIVKEVRGFSHMGPGEYQWNDVNALIESGVRMALPQLRRYAKLSIEYGELPACHCAGQDLKQVFLDLLLCATRSMEGIGTIRLRTRAEDDLIVVEIEDDGRGIPEAQLERVFDPVVGREPDARESPDFSVSYQIIRQHGGKLRVESREGKGTTVWVSLPVTSEVTAEAEAC